VWEANPKVIAALDANGLLLRQEKLSHSYPHCWRHKTPIIFRATRQWFIRMDENAKEEGGRMKDEKNPSEGQLPSSFIPHPSSLPRTTLRESAMQAVDATRFYPAWGRARLEAMIRNRPDWCVSRQRYWGVPMPFFLHRESGALHPRTLELLEEVARRVEKTGIEAWFSLDAAELLGDEARLYEKVTDTLDVWFDSGVSHACVLKRRAELRHPADLYLEGSDQHRGWFHSSLLIALLRKATPPYRAVLTHGFVVDEKGRKMSKSLGNVLDPNVLIKQHGAEILRLWTSYEDYKNDIRVSDTIISQLVDVYRRVRNTCRFLLANLYDFDPAKDALPHETLPLTERFMLKKLYTLASDIKEAYETYEFHAVIQQLHQFCSLDLSAFYLDISKDALYCLHPAHPKRRAIQTVLYETLEAVMPMMAPILSFTAEEVFEHVPYRRGVFVPAAGPSPVSVFFLDFPAPKDVPLEQSELAAFKAWLDLRTHALKALEMARKERGLKSNLDAILTIELPKGFPLPQTLPDGSVPLFEELFITSGVLVGPPANAPGEPLVTHRPETQGGLVVHALRSPHPKCERCWKHKPEVGKAHSSLMVCARCLEELGQVGLP
jgi:isoleucyl-tRNA synthetase